MEHSVCDLLHATLSNSSDPRTDPRACRVREDLAQRGLGSRGAMPSTMGPPHPEGMFEADFRSKADMGIVNVQGTTVTNEVRQWSWTGGSPGPYGVPR